MKKTIHKRETINHHYLNLIKDVPGDPEYQKLLDRERDLAVKIFDYAGELRVKAFGRIWVLDGDQVESVVVDALTEFSDSEHIEEHAKSLFDGIFVDEFKQEICEKVRERWRG